MRRCVEISTGESVHIVHSNSKPISAMEDFGTFDCKNLGISYAILPIDIDDSVKCDCMCKTYLKTDV